MDSEVEGQIISNIRLRLNNATVIVISHRLSTISKMDWIYFLTDDGKVDIDTHKGLIECSVRYQNYLAQQLKS